MAEDEGPRPGEGFYGPKGEFKRVEKDTSGKEHGIAKDTYISLKRQLAKPDVTPDERRTIREKINEIVSSVDDIQDGKYIRSLRFRVQDAVKHMTWDEVYPRLLEMATQEEDSFEGKHFFEPEMRGVIQDAMEATAARVAIAGIRQKRDNEGLPRGWLEGKGYDEHMREVMIEDANQRDFFRIIPGRPEDLVEVSLQREEDPEVTRLRARIEDQEQRFSDLTQRYLQQLMTFQSQQQQQFPFGAEEFARAMGQASPEEQLELYLRAEEVMYPMQMQLQVPSFLLSRDPIERAIEQREWRARAQLVTMAANKRMAVSYDKQFANQEAIDFTGEQLVDLMNMEGVMEGASIYAYMFAKDLDIEFLQIPNTDSTGFISSVFEIKTGPQFIAMRQGVRDMMVSRFGIEESDARDAEHIAWNLIYASNVPEEFDSVYENGREKRIPPSVPQLKALTMWMMMHPQERLVAKTHLPRDPDRAQEAMGSLGEWAVNRARKTGRKLDAEVLPRTMFRNALKEIDVVDQTSDTEISLFDVFVNNGEFIFEGRGSFLSSDDLGWYGVESPFSGYQFDVMSPAVKVFDVVAKGETKSLTELANSLRKLKVNDKRLREVFLMAVNGVKADSMDLKPAMGSTDWGIYKNQLKKFAPGFFE